MLIQSEFAPSQEVSIAFGGQNSLTLRTFKLFSFTKVRREKNVTLFNVEEGYILMNENLNLVQ